MDSKGQGAIEYLLIIGAAVIIAVIVIALMMGLAGQGTEATEEAGLGDEFTRAQCQANCEYQSAEMESQGETCDSVFSEDSNPLCVSYDTCKTSCDALAEQDETCYDLWPQNCN